MIWVGMMMVLAVVMMTRNCIFMLLKDWWL
jgi:hypothetical protein